jgi:hypothetical protein
VLVSSLGTRIKIVECARWSYRPLLTHLASRGIKPDFLAYVKAHPDSAFKRNVIRHDLEGGHYVSRSEMDTTYSNDDSRALARRYSDRAIVIDNEDSGGSMEAKAAELYERFRQSLDRRSALWET